MFHRVAQETQSVHARHVSLMTISEGYLRSQICEHCIYTVDEKLQSFTNTYRQEGLLSLSHLALHWLELAVHDDLKVICLSRDTELVLV